MGELVEKEVVESRERIGSRSYYIEVRNLRRWIPAKGVRLCLLRVEETNAFGRYQTTWAGEMPFLRRDGEQQALAPDLGAEIDYDLCSVTNMPDGPVLELHPVTRNFSAPTRWKQCRAKCALTFQARSLLVDSNLLHIEIVWDGQWAKDAEEMARHLIVTKLPL